MLWSLIVYFAVGLTITASKFFYYYLIFMLLCISSASLGLLVSACFETAETAVGVAPVLLMPMMLFSGFFSNSGSYPDWIGWV